jgi:hypothetical protein
MVNRTKGAASTNAISTCATTAKTSSLKPGELHGFPKVAVPYAKKQNPLMGTQAPINPNRYISLVGVKGEKNSEPINPEALAHAAEKLERVDRDGDFGGEPLRKVKLLRKRGFDPYEAEVGMDDTGFTAR